jgi:pimeloyl-ACP methyl ester carboxylesterase
MKKLATTAMPVLIVLLVVLLAAYLGLGSMLYINQRSILYYPTPKVDHPFKELTFNNESESIKVIVLNQGRTKSIIYFGGNGEAVAGNVTDFEYLFPAHTIYLVNYRGYGGSTGVPEEEGIYSDALYIFDQVKQNHDTVSIIGRSLGTGVATLVASVRELDKLTLVTPFDSIQNIAQDTFPIFPMSLLIKDKYDSLSRVKDIKVPTLILIAELDEVIGRKFSMNLASAFNPEQLTLEVIRGAGHNTISFEERYGSLLKAFN